MNIIWNVYMPLKPACDSLSVLVTPNDRWDDVKLSEMKLRAFKDIFRADITKDGKVFKNIPTNWYMIEN
jgi:hypothetical protein